LLQLAINWSISFSVGMRLLPHGYFYQGRNIVQNPEKAAEIDEMFRLGEEGKSFAEIGKKCQYENLQGYHPVC